MTTFVFLGPSLPRNEAKDILPDAYYLPPCACGDIVKVLSLRPKVIVIIDGFFENRPSVWHKEILYVLSQGVIVYGAASMGALRAAELTDFGMIGVGEIYEQYQSGYIIDDDEVALTHLSEQEGFAHYSLAMVNIRFTVDKALKHRIISSLNAENFLMIAKTTFYQERTLTTLKAKVQHLEGIASFLKWFEENYVDQKRLDTRRVLEVIKRGDLPKTAKVNFSNTALFRNLKIKNLSKPFPSLYDWLPTEYKLGALARLFEEYELSKRLAKVIGVAHDCGFLNIVGQELYFTQPSSADADVSERFLNCFLKLSASHYVSDVKTNSLKLLARVLAHLYSTLKQHFETIDKTSLFETIHRFYRRHQINSGDDFRLWLQEREMSLDEFKEAIELLHFYDYFVTSNNLSTLIKSNVSGVHNYFLMAISLNGLDEKIIDTFCQQKESLLDENEKSLATEGDYYAMTRDFTDSLEMREFISKSISLDTACLKAFSLMSWRLQ